MNDARDHERARRDHPTVGISRESGNEKSHTGRERDIAIGCKEAEGRQARSNRAAGRVDGADFREVIETGDAAATHLDRTQTGVSADQEIATKNLDGKTSGGETKGSERSGANNSDRARAGDLAIDDASSGSGNGERSALQQDQV